MVVGFKDSYKKIIVKLVPRLISGHDYDESMGDGKRSKISGTNMRIPKRLFNPEEYPDAKSLKSDRGRRVMVYAYGGMRFENGLIV